MCIHIREIDDEPDGKGGMSIYYDGGYYNDKLIRTPGGWRITERIEESAYSTRLNRLGVNTLWRRKS